jgi:hypothetical protein
MVTWYRRLCPITSQKSRVRCNAKRIAWMKHKCKVRELSQPQAVAVTCSDDGTRAQRSGRPRWIEETERGKKRPCRAATCAHCQTDLLCAAMTMARALSRQERYCRRPDLHAYAYAFAFAALCSAMLCNAFAGRDAYTRRYAALASANTGQHLFVALHTC